MFSDPGAPRPSLHPVSPSVPGSQSPAEHGSEAVVKAGLWIGERWTETTFRDLSFAERQTSGEGVTEAGDEEISATREEAGEAE